MELAFRVLAFTVLLPAGLAAASALVARRLRPESAGRSIAAALGVAAGYVAGHYGTSGVLPSFPPTDTLHWIPYFTLGTALLLCAFERQPPRFLLPGWLLTLALATAAAFLVGRPTWAAAGLSTAVLGISVTAVGVVLAGLGLEVASRKLPAWSLLFSLVAAATGASIASLFCHTALVAMLFGGLAATAGGLGLFGLFLKSAVPGRATLAAFTITAGALLLYVRRYGYPQPPTAPFALAGAALLGPFLATLLPASPRLRPWLAIGLSLLLAGAGAAMAYTPEGASPGAGGDY